jgi:hypothetical protein
MKFLVTILLLLLIGCSSTTSRLTSGGFTSTERKGYIKTHGRIMNERMLNGFLKGKVCIGMNQEYLFLMYGSPSRIYAVTEPGSSVRRKAWAYHEKSINADAEDVVLLWVVFDGRNRVIAVDGERKDKCLKL